LENTKIIKLDDEYIIRQGEYKIQWQLYRDTEQENQIMTS
jgi:hypothetical protein